MVHIPFSRTIKEWRTERKIKETLEATKWHFSDTRERMILRESPSWNKHYLPLKLQNLTILDVGAGEGETARLFLMNGAAKVICIEPSNEAFEYLKRNAASHPIEPLNKLFEMSDLKNQTFDFLKMDIEGYEEYLLGTKLSHPAVLEVHGLQLRDRFQAEGWRIEYPSIEDMKGYSCTTYAYWKC